MKVQIEAPALLRRTPRLVVTIVSTVLLSLASFQSAWAQTAPTLGNAKSFAVLAGQTVTNVITPPSPNTTIQGDLGVWPGSAVTNFPPGQVIAPGTTHTADAVALAAQSDLTIAYDNLAGQAPTALPSSAELGGQTLVAGVYKFGSANPAAQITGNLTLNAQGDPNAVFIFQIASTLTTAVNSSVRLINGAQPCNVFWQVGSSATLFTNTSFIGNILALTSIALQNGTIVNGRVLARNGAVTLDHNNVFFSSCSTGTTSGGDTGPIPGCGFEPGQTACIPDTPPVDVPGQVCTDVTPPTIAVTGMNTPPSGLTQVFITVRDTGSGLVTIVPVIQTNTSLNIPIFSPGTTSPQVVTATKLTAGVGSVVGLKATDFCGQVKIFDPVDFTITANKAVTVTGIPRVEHFVTIVNDGIQRLIITVNGNDDKAIWVWLRPNETRTVNIGRGMVRGDNNTITFEAMGHGKHGSAVVLVYPK